MKALFLLPLLLVACAAPKRVTVTDGNVTMTVEQTGMVGGKDFVHATRSKTGALAITTRTDMERSFDSAAQAGMMIGGGMITAGVQKAKDASDAAVAISASKQATKQAGIAAGVATEAIKAETIKATFIPPP